VKVVSTATTRELADRVGYMPGELDVPAGINAAIERACADAGIPAVGLWAQVPHYVANFPYPASALALLEALERLTGLSVDRSSLESAAADARTRLDELVAANPEHTHMVRQLETVYDDQSSTLTIPSGDELAAELERFLRNQEG
jgi:predicted ATP-grasp superfamily ATP-dependent carboligase